SDLPPSTLPAAAGWGLFLDLDGTLCGYRDDPADVALTPRLRALLARLAARLDGAVCILSGRSAADLQRLLDGLPLPQVAEHGGAGIAELDAGYRVQLDAVEAALREIAAANPGTWVERKPSSCVLHYRAAAGRAECLRTAVMPLLPAHPALRLLQGVFVYEFAARGRDKGTALTAQMQRAPFAGRVPVAVGDDVTDEDAFAAAAALQGFGVAVGPRVSASARFGLADADAVEEWIAGLVGDGHASR
ncbi:trehalose-phosphatase, partial [Tahibacter caeni]|uniref:trehalose-phosphatase n=1 Tax=Tahibacter caeni TaxID=1453545 RepID=UPI00214763BD